MSISVTVGAATGCAAVATVEVVDGERFRLPANTSRRFTQFGNSFCATNYNSQDMFIPARYPAEINAFRDNAVPGVGKF